MKANGRTRATRPGILLALLATLAMLLLSMVGAGGAGAQAKAQRRSTGLNRSSSSTRGSGLSSRSGLHRRSTVGWWLKRRRHSRARIPPSSTGWRSKKDFRQPRARLSRTALDRRELVGCDRQPRSLLAIGPDRPDLGGVGRAKAELRVIGDLDGFLLAVD